MSWLTRVKKYAPDERIVSAAIFANGEIFTGLSHWHAIQKALQKGSLFRIDDEHLESPNGETHFDLFVTNKGNVIDRFDADEFFGISASERIEKQHPTFSEERKHLKKKAQLFLGQPSWKGISFFAPEKSGEIEGIFQSRDFPNVFLGSAGDFDRAQTLAGEPICSVVDVSKVLPELPLWTMTSYKEIEPKLVQAVNQLARLIETKSCPIFVHCVAGANRSVIVLAAAISRLTGRSVLDVLKEIRSQRGIAAPHDVFLDMAVQNFEPDEPVRKKVRETVRIAKNWFQKI